MATVLTSALGTRAAVSASMCSLTTATRRLFSVSCASGVMCPPATRTTVLPGSSTRASASVIIWNRFTTRYVTLAPDDRSRRAYLHFRRRYPHARGGARPPDTRRSSRRRASRRGAEGRVHVHVRSGQSDRRQHDARFHRRLQLRLEHEVVGAGAAPERP